MVYSATTFVSLGYVEFADEAIARTIVSIETFAGGLIMVFFLRDVGAQAISLISCSFVVSLASAADLCVMCNKLAKRENRR